MTSTHLHSHDADKIAWHASHVNQMLATNQMRDWHTAHYASQIRSTICIIAMLAACFACMVSLSGCNEPPPPPPQTLQAIANKTAPRWVHQNQPHAKVALVFVHGIFGDTMGTWTNANGTTFFDILRKDPKLEAGVDMFAFGYTSEMFKSGSLDIQEAANKLNEHLQYHKVNDYPAIVFIAHSMGGLVTLRHLLAQREQLAKVPVLILLGTPQEGAQIASIAKYVMKNDALLQMMPADRDGYLRNLNDEWRSIKAPARRPVIRCGYEKQATFGQMIVPWSSATRFCDGAASALAADHLGIVKPAGPEDDAVILVVNALNEFVIGKTLAAKLETPDFIHENDQFIFKLSNAYAKQKARVINSGAQPLKFTIAEVSDPGLSVWPDDTPRELGGNESSDLRFGLAYGASETTYTFVLKSDIPTEQKVTVKVGDIQKIAAQQEQLATEVAAGLTTFVSDPVRKLVWNKANTPEADVHEAIVEESRRLVAEKNPSLPVVGQWVVATELLNSFNWQTLGQRALKKVEVISPASAKSINIQRLAQITATQSGKPVLQKLPEFLPAPAPAPPTSPSTSPSTSRATPPFPITETPRKNNPLTTSAASANSLRLATEMQTVTALKPFGLSLKGDVQLAQGDKAGATKSINEAVAILPSPSLKKRIPIETAQAVQKVEPAIDKTMQHLEILKKIEAKKG